jgi:hypothetical protein
MKITADCFLKNATPLFHLPPRMRKLTMLAQTGYSAHKE